MPATIKKRRTAQATRKSIHRGKNSKKCGRKGGQRAKQKNPRVIANSVFALTLHTKPGLEVIDKMDGRKSYDKVDDYHKMYRDLLAAFQNGMNLIGQPTKVDPLKEGLDIGASLAYVVNGFRNNLLIAGYDMRIDKDDDHYYFTFYIQCDFPNWWHAFEIFPIVEFLGKNNPKLHDLFIKFIAFMSTRLHIPTWYNGGMGYSEYYVEEQSDLEIWEDHNGPTEPDDAISKEQIAEAKISKEKYERLLDDFNNYSAGVIKEYENFIRSGWLPLERLKKELARYRSNKDLISWMKEMLEFMKEPGSMNDYHYAELMEEENYEGLSFDRQSAIIWNWNDSYTEIEMECIDSDANNIGIIPPIFHYHLSKNTKSLNMDRYIDWQSWPLRFSKLWEKYRDIVNGYRKKLKQKK